MFFSKESQHAIHQEDQRLRQHHPNNIEKLNKSNISVVFAIHYKGEVHAFGNKHAKAYVKDDRMLKNAAKRTRQHAGNMSSTVCALSMNKSLDLTPMH